MKSASTGDEWSPHQMSATAATAAIGHTQRCPVHGISPFGGVGVPYRPGAITGIR